MKSSFAIYSRIRTSNPADIFRAPVTAEVVDPEVDFSLLSKDIADLFDPSSFRSLSVKNEA